MVNSFLIEVNAVGVGAAEGCDLLILLFGLAQKDRSLRQLLRVRGVFNTVDTD
jgi:hypothetical protein